MTSLKNERELDFQYDLLCSKWADKPYTCFVAFLYSYNSEHVPFDVAVVFAPPPLLSNDACACGVGSPLAFLLMGLRDGALGREGRLGLVWGGPGCCSSKICEQIFNILQQYYSAIYFKAEDTISERQRKSDDAQRLKQGGATRSKNSLINKFISLISKRPFTMSGVSFCHAQPLHVIFKIPLKTTSAMSTTTSKTSNGKWSKEGNNNITHTSRICIGSSTIPIIQWGT